MPERTCAFCTQEVPEERLITGANASLCTSCLAEAASQTLTSVTTRTTEIPEGDLTCAWCEKPAPRSQSYVLDLEKGPAICTACIARSYSRFTDTHELGHHRSTYWKHVGEGSTRELLHRYFADAGYAIDGLVTTTRKFAVRLRVDLQAAVHELFDEASEECLGIRSRWSHEPLDFAKLLEKGVDGAAIAPLQWEEIDVGEDTPRRCVKSALWIGTDDEMPFAVVLSQQERTYGCEPATHVELAAPAGEQGTRWVEDAFKKLEQAVSAAPTYRGKVLSLEQAQRHHQGRAGKVIVHRLEPLSRDQVILPATTLELLERNVFDFVKSRNELKKIGMPVKKGLLFYGPPGTGKTHTIRYLMKALPDHTTLLVTAEQVGLIDEYVSLARLLLPSILVIEDVDLIARQRETLETPIQEALLNRLLNEMDGLREDAEMLFILTTNHPETLEAALSSRPGRIDQAIEFPLPDAESRAKLVALYARGLELPAQVADLIVEKTDGVSAAFIKELMRRTAQFAAERLDASDTIQATEDDMSLALDEMLFAGGSLNVRLLGGAEPGV